MNYEKSGKKRGGNFDRINRMKRIKRIERNYFLSCQSC